MAVAWPKLPGGQHGLRLPRRTLLGDGVFTAMEIERRRALIADEIVGRLSQSEDLPPREPLQISEDRHGLLPVVADPGKRLEDQATMLAAQAFHQTLWRFAGSRRIGRQFRAIAGNVGGIRGSEGSPELGQADLLPNALLAEPGAAVQLSFQPEGQSQQVFVGQVEPVASG